MRFLFQVPKNEACEEEIEMSNIEDSEPKLIEGQRKSSNGCLSFLKKSKLENTENTFDIVE